MRYARGLFLVLCALWATQYTLMRKLTEQSAAVLQLQKEVFEMKRIDPSELQPPKPDHLDNDWRVDI